MTHPSPISGLAERLLPCPFCGGEAERVDIEDGDNAGGSFVHCTACDASGNLEFGFKENFISNWNRRASDPEDDSHAFKNFHRLLCERFDYTHDEVDWRRDQVSLIEWIAGNRSPLTALESPLPVAAQGVDALHIVFDGPPDRDGGRFVEVETPDGRSVNIGEWHHRPDNLWELRIPSNVNLLRRAMDYLSDIYNPEDEALYRLRNDIEASLTKTAAPLGVEPTDEQVNLAAEVIWNDRDARMGGPWNLRNPDEVVVLQTKATARAALKAAALPAPDAQAVVVKASVDGLVPNCDAWGAREWEESVDDE